MYIYTYTYQYPYSGHRLVISLWYIFFCMSLKFLFLNQEATVIIRLQGRDAV